MSRSEKYVLHDGHQDGRTWRQRLGDAGRAAWRSFRIGPLRVDDPEISRYFGGGPTLAGVSVSESAVLGLSAVFCAVSTISSDIAALPLKLYRQIERGREPYTSHPVYGLLHDHANPEMTAYVFRQTMMQSVLTTGNAYAEVQRDHAGRPKYLWPIMPASRVSIDRETGVLRYRVRNVDGDVMIDAHDMLHFRGPSADGVLGLDPIHTLRDMFGLTLAVEHFAARFFANSTVMGGTVTTPHALNEQTRKALREAIEARHQGADRAHKLMLLEGGMTYTPQTANLQHAQFTELRTHQVREVARAFRMPPSKLGDLADATFSNVEQENQKYLTQCLQPWLKMIESELTVKLISSMERRQQTIEFVVDGILRADVEKRGNFYAQLVSHGIATPNELRGLENWPALPGGDALRVPANTVALEEDSRSWARLSPAERTRMWDSDPDRARSMMRRRTE